MVKNIAILVLCVAFIIFAGLPNDFLPAHQNAPSAESHSLPNDFAKLGCTLDQSLDALLLVPGGQASNASLVQKAILLCIGLVCVIFMAGRPLYVLIDNRSSCKGSACLALSIGGHAPPARLA